MTGIFSERILDNPLGVGPPRSKMGPWKDKSGRHNANEHRLLGRLCHASHGNWRQVFIAADRVPKQSGSATGDWNRTINAWARGIVHCVLT